MNMNKLKIDFSGVLFSTVRRLTSCLSRTCWSLIVKLSLKLRGISYGQACIFYGLSHFRRYYNSKIDIGHDCRFRSSFLSNYIGLNRRCLIATHAENSEIIIGHNVGFSGTVIGAAEKITIGNNVLCGGNTLITDFDWHPVKRNGTNNKIYSAPISIEDNVWLGVNVVVLKGVTIGKRTVIGANSVVTKSIPGDVIAAGNPCKVIKYL